MPDSLREREKSEEAKYKLDEEHRFKTLCRRNKLMGLKAAARLGFSGTAADAYARQLVTLLLEDADIDAILPRVLADLRAAGVPVAAEALGNELAQCTSQAEEDLLGDWHALDVDHVPIGG